MTSGAAWVKCLAVEVRTGEDRTQEARQPIGESGCLGLRSDQILAYFDEKAGESKPSDLLVQSVSPKSPIVRFVVADAKSILAKRRYQRLGEAWIAIPQDANFPRPWEGLPRGRKGMN